MHWQAFPHCQKKKVKVIDGQILDVILDLRLNSDSFGGWTAFRLGNESTFNTVEVPEGFAHGFFVCGSSPALVSYVVDVPRVAEAERRARADFLDLGSQIHQSDLDRAAPIFGDLGDESLCRHALTEAPE